MRTISLTKLLCHNGNQTIKNVLISCLGLDPLSCFFGQKDDHFFSSKAKIWKWQSQWGALGIKGKALINILRIIMLVVLAEQVTAHQRIGCSLLDQLISVCSELFNAVILRFKHVLRVDYEDLSSALPLEIENRQEILFMAQCRTP